MKCLLKMRVRSEIEFLVWYDSGYSYLLDIYSSGVSDSLIGNRRRLSKIQPKLLNLLRTGYM
jgi:hypothetical protein